MKRSHPDHSLIALGVRQPWAELIVRGIKTVEVRTVPTRVRGTIYVYASRTLSTLDQAGIAADRQGIETDQLCYGQLVGMVDIVDCRPMTSADLSAACLSEPLSGKHYAWRLENAHRLETPLSVKYLPYGVWFYPFERRGTQSRKR